MVDNRRFTRWNIDLPTTVTLEGAQACADCKVSNISFKGAQICVGIKLAKDTFIKLCLNLTGGFSLSVEACVVWQKTIDGHNIYGLYFTKISDADKEKIYRFLRRDYPQQVNQSWWRDTEKGGENMKTETLQDKRVFARFAKSFPVRFLEANTYTEMEAEATDISAKGIGIVSDRKLIPSVPLELWLDIPDKGEPLYIRGNVVWSKPSGLDRYRCGISFEKADLLGLARVLRAK